VSLKLLSRGERDHKIDSKDLPGNNLLRIQVFGEIAKNLLQPRPFFELMFDTRLDVLHILFHRSQVLFPL
jgi:hypothetical protein